MCLSSVKIVSILHHRMIPAESCNKPEVVDLLSRSGSYLVVRVSFTIVIGLSCGFLNSLRYGYRSELSFYRAVYFMCYLHMQ